MSNTTYNFEILDAFRLVAGRRRDFQIATKGANRSLGNLFVFWIQGMPDNEESSTGTNATQHNTPWLKCSSTPADQQPAAPYWNIVGWISSQ